MFELLGESGAGKTESTKVILQYLTAVTTKAGDNQKSWVEEQILEANTVLESFGNAKTVRNNNSSRFGKFVQVLFDIGVTIIGAVVINYLLEKSRVVRQAKTERNYHVFYELVAGATADERAKYKLPGAAADFNYLNTSGCIEIPNVNDKKNFEALKLALSVLKMSPVELDQMFQAISAILHLGNVTFTKDEAKDCSSVAGKAVETVKTVASLLGVPEDKLTSALLNRRITVRNESTLVPLKVDQANDNRDSISKSIYDKLFNYIVAYINTSTATQEKPANFIGVLDIFGFELFEVNSFEQLCINYTNEKLQQFFNQFIFKLEQDEYAKEGIPVESITFKDNQPCLDLIEAKGGVLSMLDEECKVPKGTDDTFLAKIHEAHAKNEYYVKPRTATPVFGIKHYAGEVTYQIAGFMDKNKDSIQDEIFELFQAAQNPLMPKLFKPEAPAASANDKGGAKAKVTSGSNFKNQLLSLVATLSTTSPHYVRCVKPNMEKKAFVFDETLTVAQLRYAGMLETIRIRKSGFPMRFPYDQYNSRFRFLLKANSGDDKSKAMEIMRKVNADASLWKAGKGKIFMKQQVLDKVIDENNKLKARYVVLLQKTWRGLRVRQKFKKQKKAAIFLQKYCKMFVYRRRYLKKKKAIVKIQSVIRGWFARDYLRQLKAEKKAAEEALRKAKEEEERKKAEEERKKIEEERKKNAATNTATPLSPVSPTADKAAEDAEKKERAEEEKKLAEYAAQANAAIANKAKGGTKVPGNASELDSLFAFLDDFGSGGGGDTKEKKLGKQIASDMEDIFKLDDAPIVVAPKAPPAPGAQGNISKSKSNLQLAGSSAPDAPPPPPPPVPSRALKSNPLAKAAAATPAVVEKNQEDRSIKVFAEKFFNEHPKPTGTLSMATFKKNKETLTLEEMLMHSKAPMPNTLIKLPNAPQATITIATEAFKTLGRVLDPVTGKQDDAVNFTKKLIEIGIKNPDLRDELYVQCIRQITPNPALQLQRFEDTIAQGWSLLSLYASVFPPSKQFSKYLLHYFGSNSQPEKDAKDKSQLAKIAVYCETAVKKVMLNGARKMIPGTMEMRNIKTLAPMLCRFYLMDGQIKALPIISTTTAADIVSELSKKIDMKECNGWSIYEVAEDPWEEHMIRGQEYIADIIAFWESTNRASAKPTDFDTVKAKRPGSLGTIRGNSAKQLPGVKPSSGREAVGAGETKLYMKKRVFKNPNDVPVDPVEFNLIYSQAAMDVRNDVYPMNEKVAMQFAALKCQVDWGDFDAKKTSRLDNLKAYLPNSILGNQQPATWVKGISEIQQKLVGKNAIQARLLYLEALKQFKHYGSTLFAVKYMGFWQHPENILLAVSSASLHFMTKSKTILESFSYKQVYTWETENDTITINILRSAGAPGKENANANADRAIESFKFQSRHVDDISSLLKDYSSKVGADKKKEREMYVTEAELGMYNKDLDKSRTALVKKKLVNIAEGKAGPVSLNQLFVKPGEKPAESAPAAPAPPKEGGKEKDIDATKYLPDWNQRMASLAPPLLTIFVGHKELSQACKMINDAIVEYASYDPIAAAKVKGANKDAIPPDWLVIQRVIQPCFEEPKLIDELYMELIRHTTENPVPDSKESIRLWKLFAVCIGTFKPTIPEVVEYVRCYLRRYQIVLADTPSEKVRKEEILYAKYCTKQLSRTLQHEQRKFMPGQEEIQFVSKLGPVYTKIYVPDGQYRALAFEPSTTVAELTEVLKEKLKLTGVVGFTIFAVKGTLERAVAPYENLCDIIGKWDKSMKQNPITDPKKMPRLVLKRRLHPNPMTPSTNDTEEEFSLVQAMEDIMSARFPLNQDDAVFLAGLRAQVEAGDEHPDKKTNYKAVMEKAVPPRFQNDQVQALIQREHSSFRGKSTADCRRLYMARIRKWPLYGSTIFDVSQNYTSDYPADCWLLVNYEGIHISARNNKAPLVSYKYAQLGAIAPDEASIMLTLADREKKFVFHTSAAAQIAALMRDYQALLAPAPPK